MKKRMNSFSIAKHVVEYSSLYIFHSVLFLMGVVFGAIVVNSLSATQKDDLFYFLNEFFVQLSQGELVRAGDVFWHSFLYNGKFVGLIWLLGISMIGLPLILILLFLKGMVIGFTIGFLVQQMGFKGFLLSFAGVLPQNLIIVPTFIAAAVLSVAFSLQMIRKLFVKSLYQPFAPMLMRYIIAYGIFLLALGLASFVEGYFTPYFMKNLLGI